MRNGDERPYVNLGEVPLLERQSRTERQDRNLIDLQGRLPAKMPAPM
jgi:hypothetical protein